MKRSKTLRLAVLGAGTLALTACDDPQEAAVFEDVEQCMSQEGFDRETCEAHFRKAEAEHVRVSPKYIDKADCEADFGAGQCEIAPVRTTTGGSVFMPMMMGYMMGNMLAGGSRVATQPLYRSGDDKTTFRTADNRQVAARTGLNTVPSSVAKAPSVKTQTVARGGFGARAGRMGGTFRGFGG